MISPETNDTKTKTSKKHILIVFLFFSLILLLGIVFWHFFFQPQQPSYDYSVITTSITAEPFRSEKRLSSIPPYREWNKKNQYIPYINNTPIPTEEAVETPAPTVEPTTQPEPTPSVTPTPKPTAIPVTKAPTKQSVQASAVTKEPKTDIPTTSVETQPSVSETTQGTVPSGISFGIDVSKWQGTIDWNKVRKAGKEFAFIKFGGRDVSELAYLYIDETFNYNITQASANGLRVGIYFFSQAITPEEAVEEANFIAANIKGIHLDYPIVFDWEIRANTRGTNANLSAEQHIAIAHSFVNTLKSHGYETMLYGSISSPMVQSVLPTLSNCRLWLARYTNDINVKPNYNGDYRIWQYSESGRVDGIKGNVDLDIQLY